MPYNIHTNLYSPVQSWRKFSAVLRQRVNDTGAVRQRIAYVLWYDVTKQFKFHSACRSFTNLYVHEDNGSLHTR